MIEKYNTLITEIVKQFSERYFLEVYKEEFDDYYLDIMEYNGVIEGPVNLSDYYFSIDDILIAEHHQIPCKIFQKYYDMSLEKAMNDEPTGISLYHYWKKCTS